MSTSPQATYLKDYSPSNFLIDEILLEVELYETHAHTQSTLHIRRNPDATTAGPLVLDGNDLTLKSIQLNNTLLTTDQYQVTDTQLIIQNPPDAFILQIAVETKPQENLRLSGLYKSGQNFCTQCESHGFRRITYYLDRPDVLARFTTIISAEQARYPILLSNGNPVERGTSAGGRHWVKWQDPTLKPCYLFALIAGNLDSIQDTFVTRSGRTIQLFLYVEKGKGAQASYAMECLKEAMQWDEEKYGREYDLDIFMIVAVSDFNFGAMENKGLNIFNDRYILANAETATDEDFIAIKNVVGHEYFHNWSGNRVTVRDWFQITLKEGLTVFRDQQFTAEKTSLVAKRIQEAKNIRNLQFAQDAGPMAHPIYPDSYIEINNFYTVTVYEKGAEVIRMIHTLLGEEAFRKAMDLYFSRHDGHPATAHDFVQAMQDSSGLDLTQFWRWYKQAGTPTLTVKDAYNPTAKTYTLTIQQSCPTTTEPFHIPVRMGLLDEHGQELPLQLAEENTAQHGTKLLSIKHTTETFCFVNIPTKPIPSLLRNFSAPVKLINENTEHSEENYLFLLAHDTDLFNRWDAAQQLATKILIDPASTISTSQFLQALEKILSDHQLDPAVVAEILTLPSESYLLEQSKTPNVDAIHAARESFKKTIASTLHNALLNRYQQYNIHNKHLLDSISIGQRKLKNILLSYLTLSNEPNTISLVVDQFKQSNNMSDTIGSLLAVNNIDCPERVQLLSAFYEHFQKDALVIYKWFTLQAQSSLPNTLAVVKSLTQHTAFDIKNPNSARSLIHAFCSGNPVRFHALTGEGYAFLTDYVLTIDQFNPSLAARIIEPLIHWKKYDAKRQALMKTQLERIANTKPLSNDVYEIVSRSLS